MRYALIFLAMAAPAAAAEGDYSLTVYSSAQPGQIDTQRLARYGDQLPGYALVRDTRRLRLEPGLSTLRFTDVAARMDPTTVSFASTTDPGGTRVIEQAYQYDLVSSDKLLQRFIGETVSVDLPLDDRYERISGTLLSAEGGLTLSLPDGEIASLSSWSAVRFPSLPGGLITRPTLVWTLDAARGGEHVVQVAYQASGLTWWADYNATLDPSQGCRLDLGAWVTLVNQSGGSFPNARLKLVAGEVNRAPAADMPVPMMASRQAMAMEVMDDGGFRESSLFEYHLYTLGRRTDLPDNATKQIELFPDARGVRCSKQLVFTAAPRFNAYYGGPQIDQGYAASSKGEVAAFLEFKNDKDNSLGMALPAGRVRVNQANAADGSLEFIGEDVIGHTPRNETLTLKLGKSFDVVGDRRQTDFRIDTAGKWLEESFEISVRNRKEEAVEVRVREYAYRWSQWSLKSHSHPFSKRDAQTIDFPLQLAADTEVKLRYTIRYSW